MSNLHSNLIFNFNGIDNTLEKNPPKVVYRYFDSEYTRTNFMKGYVWFCGPNKNRFFQSKHGGVNDPFEYRNSCSSHIFEYSLSCSKEIVDESRYNVEIHDLDGFINELVLSIKNCSGHQVSWLNSCELNEYAKTIPVIKMIQGAPVKEEETVSIWICGVGGETCRYENINMIKRLGSPELARNARSINDDFKDENEFRIFLNTGDFNVGRVLQHKVEYIKLYCPEIKQYCSYL